MAPHIIKSYLEGDQEVRKGDVGWDLGLPQLAAVLKDLNMVVVSNMFLFSTRNLGKMIPI